MICAVLICPEKFLHKKKFIMRKYFFSSLFLLWGQAVFAQTVLTATTNQRISYTQLPLVEPHLAVNSRNLDHMVVAAIAFDSAATSENRTHIIVFATKDNGKTWKQSDLKMTVGYDPWVAIRDNNHIGLVALAGYGAGHRHGFVYYFSTDGGFTWSSADTVSFGSNHDHPTMITDPNTNRLYILSNLIKRDSAKQMHSYAWLNYSDDWRTFQKIPAVYHMGAIHSNTLTVNVNPRGGLFIPFVEYNVVNDRPGNPVFKYLHSPDGKNFSRPYLITAQAGLSKGFAVSATDCSGKYKGRTYFVKNTGTSSLRSNGLYVHYQDSIGDRWSKEIRIDHNNASEKFLRTAAIAVNKQGVVGVAWVDRRNDPGLKKNDIYFTVSTDGGQTFLPEIRITDQSSDPQTLENGKAGERFISGGDYMGCVAKPDGSFQIVWADSRTNIFQIYTANVRVR